MYAKQETFEVCRVYLHAKGYAWEAAARTLEARFIKGGQQRVETSRKTEKSIDHPVSAMDWIKLLIVTWQPTLRFGWLIPKTRKIEVAVSQTDVYYNIYPLSWREEIPDIADHISFLIPDKIDWLMAQPASKEEVESGMHEIMEWQSIRYFLMPGINPQAVALFLSEKRSLDRYKGDRP